MQDDREFIGAQLDGVKSHGLAKLIREGHMDYHPSLVEYAEKRERKERTDLHGDQDYPEKPYDTLLNMADFIYTLTNSDDEELNIKIAFLLGYQKLPSPQSPTKFEWLSPNQVDRKRCWEGWFANFNPPSLTSSVDAAIEAAEPNAAELIRGAINTLSKKFNLHIQFWPEDQLYTEWLARFLTAEVLISKAKLLKLNNETDI